MLSSQIRAANPASSTIRQPRRRILYCTLSAVFRSHSRLIPGLSDTIRHSTCLPILFEAVHWHSTADHKWTMLALFSVVRTVTATVERAAGFISIHATHVGSDNCYTPRGGSRLAFAFAAFILLRCLCTQTSSFRSQRTPRTLPRTRHSMADI